jgi:hypothetical protein
MNIGEDRMLEKISTSRARGRMDLSMKPPEDLTGADDAQYQVECSLRTDLASEATVRSMIQYSRPILVN